jgi:Uma2 family endonuclease
MIMPQEIKSMSITTDTPIRQRIEYPESDGKPLGETDVHRREIAQIIEMLTLYFQSTANVYVSGNLMFYYEKGNPSAVTSPDIFVVKGVQKGLRRTYKLWEEQQPPVVVFEMTSRSTRLEDKGNKRALYAMLGVREYFMFDPLEEYLKPPLQGFRLLGEEYIVIDQAEDGSLISQELGLRLSRKDSFLQLINIATNQPLLRPVEIEAARQAEAKARQAEAKARQAEAKARRAAEIRAKDAEDEVARLRAELARLRDER